MLNRDQLYPVLALGSPGPDEPAVGHGLVVRLVEGNEQGPVGPDELRASNLTAHEARRIALDNLARFADESPALSIQPMLRPLTRMRCLSTEHATLRVSVARAPLELE